MYWTIADKDDTARAQLQQRKKKRKIIIIINEDIQGLLRLGSVKLKFIFNQFESAHPDLPYAWRSWNTWEHEIELFLNSQQQGNNDNQNKEPFRSI